MIASLAKFFADGGIWMYPILLLSAVSWSLSLERVYALFFRFSINSNAFVAQIQKLVMANNIDRAIKLCNATPRAVLPRVLKSALTRANKGEEEISNALEIATAECMSDITKRTGLLPTIANLATLCGLLGTIVGLIQAFSAVALAPPDMKSQLLTESLAIGLNATAFGLSVAIPTLAFFVFLNSATKKLVDDIDVYALKIQYLLIARGRPGLNTGASLTEG
jgi:biopolymer transport protein ExbB